MKKRKHKEKNKKEPLERIVRGIISTNSKGVGYLTTTFFKQDIEINSEMLNTALNNDEVEVEVLPLKKNERPKGQVTQIIRRAKDTFVGVVEETPNAFFVIPDDRKMYTDIFIPKFKTTNLKSGLKVLVKIINWKDPKKNPEGKVLEVLGEKGKHEVEIRSIILERGIDETFSEEISNEAEHIKFEKGKITQEEFSKRRDFRNISTFTIDPKNAKDFDDAISITKINDNTYEIGVHIADVSHYVRTKTKIDKEAENRSFSVYLVDRTIPMLPEILSNDLCSLNPNEEKLAFSAVFEITNDSKVIKQWFGKTVIKSDKRFTYEEAQDVIDNGGKFEEELRILNKIAKQLEKKKLHYGAIDFEQQEIQIEIDENGKPVKISKKSRLDTHKLVEEFMLLANRKVAEFISKNTEKKKGAIGVYRIHDMPKREKIIELSFFLKALGYDLPHKDGEVKSKDFNALLDSINGSAEESLIKTAAVRSMAKAIYSTVNIGHFGLAFEYYTHFTSPIRRYADLLVHRILETHLTNAKISSNEFERLHNITKKMSEKEIMAAEAERSSYKYKQVEYMSERIGQEFNGIISGVTEWGIYVEEKETRSEGMVRLKSLTDDFYVLDPKQYSIIGEKTKKKYSLGDKVHFKVVAANLDQKNLDYQLI
ncbi:MAG: ribonuclease R [Candidatus Paceibacterota bacterium]